MTEPRDARSMRPRRRRWLLRIAAMLVGAALPLLLVELLLRATGSYALDRVARHFDWLGAKTHGEFVIDPEMGFRPVVGEGGYYSAWGTSPNRYQLRKTPGVERVLFVGDSVTARGAIVRAVQNACGEQREFWNAGVESFNTRQETEFYRRYNAELAADHVVLTFHPNDFEVTPVTFLDGDGELVVFGPKTPFRMSRWVYENLHLARLWVALTTSRRVARESEARAVRAALIDLRRALAPQQRFTVLVLPLFAPAERWEKHDRWAHQRILAMLRDLGIRHFDLWPVVERALADGIAVEETPGDRWHPSEALAQRMGESLCGEGLLR